MKKTKVFGGPLRRGGTINSWMAEVFLSFKSLGLLPKVPPISGTVWNANFCRLDHDTGKNDKMVLDPRYKKIATRIRQIPIDHFRIKMSEERNNSLIKALKMLTCLKPKSKLPKQLMISLFILGFGIPLAGQPTKGNTFHLLIGTYTESGRSEGIYVYEFNSDTGDFAYKTVASGVLNPSYLAISNDKKFVYSVNETGGEKGGVSSFSFDSKSGDLTFLNTMSSGGNGPCYIAIDKQSKFVYVGNYGGGSLGAIPVMTDGSLGTSIQSIRHEGQGPTPNQKSSHVHATVPSGDDRFLYVTDLGTDKIHIYELTPKNPNPLTPATPAYVRLPAGSGPRHFTLHPNGKFAYVINELTGQLTAFSVNNGTLQPLQTLGMLPASYKGNQYEADAADIHISPDGKFLYGSLRADINELVLFQIASNGRLAYRNRYSTLGEGPRNFAIDPSGNFLLAGNSGSDEIIIFKRNKKNGELTPAGKKISLGSPVCLKFVAKD